jgi:hypothetical protein
MTGGSPFVPSAPAGSGFYLRDGAVEASEYGAVADQTSVTDAATTASSATVTSVTGGFTQSDVGKAVNISKSVLVATASDGAATGNTFVVTSATISPQASWVGKAITVTDGVVRLSTSIQAVSGTSIYLASKWGVRSITDLVATSGSANISSATALFDATNDAGATVASSGVLQSSSTISSVGGLTTATLNKTASASSAGATATITRAAAQTGLTITVHDALNTTIATYVDTNTVTLTDAPNVTSVNATIIYGTDNSTKLQNAVNASSGRTLRLPSGPMMIATGITVEVPCTIEGQGMPTGTAMTGGTKLVYCGTGKALWINSTSTGATVTGRNFGIDGNNAGATGLAIGTTTGSNKSSAGSFTNVNVSRFQTANWHLISTAVVNFFNCYAQNSRGGPGVLCDNATSSAFNTSLNWFGCTMTGNRYGFYAKDLRQARLLECEVNSNSEEAVILEKQTGTTFLIKGVTFDSCRFEQNLSGQGVANTGRWQMKVSELGTSAFTTLAVRSNTFSLGSGQTSDKDLYVRGGDITLWNNQWSPTSTGYGVTAPNISTAVTKITEWTNDVLVGTVDSTQYSIGTGVKGVLFRNNAGVWERWHASGAAFALAESSSAAGLVSLAAGTATTAGGATGFVLGSAPALGVYFGSGAPSISASKGSLYLRTDGSGTSDRAYINTNGSTTWTAITTAA